MRPLALHTPCGLSHPLAAGWARLQVTPTAAVYSDAAFASAGRDRPWQDAARAAQYAARGQMVQMSQDARRKALRSRKAIVTARATIETIVAELASSDPSDFKEGEREAIEAELEAARAVLAKASQPKASRKDRRRALADAPKAKRRAIWAEHVQVFARSA